MTAEPRSFARNLRRRQTGPEELLWRHLRGRKLGGLKFRRQVPLGMYTVDFLCLDRKLIVEIDGKQHGWESEYDDARTLEIEAMGFQVIRFRNETVLDEIDDVLAAILAVASPVGAPSSASLPSPPSPLPQGRGGKVR